MLIILISGLITEKALAVAREKNYTVLLFLNVSPRAMVAGEFIPTVRRVGDEYRLDPACLVFELTERETVANFNLLEKLLFDLKDAMKGSAMVLLLAVAVGWRWTVVVGKLIPPFRVYAPG